MAVEKTNDTEYKALFADNDKVVIKFYADWCGSCKLISPKYRRLSEDADNDGMLFLDVNAEENPELRKWAGVNNLPFFATVNAGQIVEGTFTAKIDSVASMVETLRKS